MHCPRDSTKLDKTTKLDKASYFCSSCKGVFVPISLVPSLRKIKSSKILALKLSSLKCSSCKKEMREHTYKDVEIDICINCRSVWFDLNEAHLLEKSNNMHENEELRWYDGIDPISVIVDYLSSEGSSSCSGESSSDVLGEIISGVFSGL